MIRVTNIFSAVIELLQSYLRNDHGMG